MQPISLPPARSAVLVDGLLTAFREIKDLVCQPPFEGQFERIAGILRAAKAATEEAVTIPASPSDGKETGISRQGIQFAVEGEISRLAHLKVALGMHLAHGEPLTADPARAFVSAAIVIRSLLASPTLNPRLEVGDVDLHAADPFPDA